jgi:hypothetical protein
MMSPSAFARHIGVSQQAISRAIRVGRLTAYDAAGLRVSPDFSGRKFLKPEEASVAFQLSRARIDDFALAEMARSLGDELVATLPEAPAAASKDDTKTLLSVKTAKEWLQSEILRVRLARERGELVSRAATLAAFEDAGRTVALEVQSIASWAEECAGVFQTGGVAALAALLRAKSAELLNSVADQMEKSLPDPARNCAETGQGVQQ